MKAGSTEERLQKLVRGVVKGADMLSAGLVLLIVGIVFWGILVRYLPISGWSRLWVEEGAISTLIWLTFVVGALLEGQKNRSGRHFAVLLLCDHLPPRIRSIVTVIGEIVGLAAFAVLTLLGVRYCIAVRDAKTFNVQWPFTIYTIPVVLGSLLIVVFIMSRLISTIRKRFQR